MERDIKCNTCGRLQEKSDTFKSCESCKEVFYCSIECQIRDWRVGDHGRRCDEHRDREIEREGLLILKSLILEIQELDAKRRMKRETKKKNKDGSNCECFGRYEEELWRLFFYLDKCSRQGCTKKITEGRDCYPTLYVFECKIGHGSHIIPVKYCSRMCKKASKEESKQAQSRSRKL